MKPSLIIKQMRKLFINSFTESLILCILAAAVAWLYLVLLPMLLSNDLSFYVGALIIVFGPFIVRECVSKIVEYFIEK